MQKIFYNKSKQEDDAFIYTLTNEGTNEKRYFYINKKPTGQIIAEDITYKTIEQTKEKPMAVVDAISALQMIIIELTNSYPILRPENF